MRIWNLDPQIYCTNHRTGLHYECHKAVGAINKNKNIRGYIENGLIDISLIKVEHDRIAKLLKHKSPLPEINYDNVPEDLLHMHRVDTDKNLQDLLSRCSECRKRYEEMRKNE